MVLEKSQIAEELFVWPLPEISISAKLSSLGASKLVYTIYFLVHIKRNIVYTNA
jgi:hypothetical protein